MQKRAVKGGEVGANGEWYEGGKFIATTERAKTEGTKPKGSGKQEIAPYVWEIAPEGMKSLYRMIGMGIYGAWDRAEGKVVINPCAETLMTQNGITRETVQNLIDRYNAGQRWIETSAQM